MIANKETIENAEVIENKYDLAEKTIKKGEKCRILFEILLDELGMTFNNTHTEVWNRLKNVNDEYEESIKLLSELVHINGKKQTKTPTKSRGVSVSN